MKRFELYDGECLYGGSAYDGAKNPFTKDSVYHADFRKLCVNQTMPLYLSTKGRYFYSETPFAVTIENGAVTFEGGDVKEYAGGSSLRDAYLAAMRAHFPFDGRALPEAFFRTAQYNTWMEYTYDPTEEKVLSYAKAVLDNGFAPGILIIDEGWHGRYGQWEFDPHKFPHPKEMIEKLHAMGFKVLLWVVPLVCPDGQFFIRHCFENLPDCDKDASRLFVRTKEGEVALFKWWNGYSAALDMRKDCDREFLDKQLRHLMRDYGVDGFKFDGGTVDMYHAASVLGGTARDDEDAHAMNQAWNEFGRRYDYHEYKDTYHGGGKCGIQRLCDKDHRWIGNGIDTFVPASAITGLLGHPFICPDMIGGGEWIYNTMKDFKVDEELFVRMAEASALLPMMQFSWAPWRLLSKEALENVKRMAQLHCSMSDTILALVKKALETGEPIVRFMEYNYPHCGYHGIIDQFMLGESILVAPVITKGTRSRNVVFPSGKWRSQDGEIFDGECTREIESPLGKLLYFEKI